MGEPEEACTLSSHDGPERLYLIHSLLPQPFYFSPFYIYCLYIFIIINTIFPSTMPSVPNIVIQADSENIAPLCETAKSVFYLFQGAKLWCRPLERQYDDSEHAQRENDVNSS